MGARKRRLAGGPMAMSTLDPVALHANEVPCPRQGCDRSFTCDACLHAHLLRRYGVRYVDVFGPTQDAWLHFCDDHAGAPPSMLGV